ncbi:MAG: SpoIIE family protein phosphatase [Gammaproteobacteria bacterium]
MKVLVVDDSEDILSLLCMILENWGYEVIAASDGQEAWEIVQRGGIQLVISDWLMPRMDGVEFCHRVRSTSFDHYIYLILLTSLSDTTALVKGLNAGANDFMVKPFQPEELQVRIRAGERVLALERQLEERNRRLADTYQMIERDLQSAADLQKSLLPAPATLQNVSWEWLFRPSHYVAGDVFDYFSLDESHLGFYQLDVAGHGIPSALMSFTLTKVMAQGAKWGGLLKRATDSPPYYKIVSPELVVRELNQRFEPKNDDRLLYFTIAYGVIDTRAHCLTLCQAGHPSPLWLKRAGGAVEAVGQGGFPVGMFPAVEYEVIHLDLQKGDRMFVYSDGVTDCESKSGELFSVARLREMLTAAADQPLLTTVKTLGEALREWKGDEHYQDDITLLAFEYGANS